MIISVVQFKTSNTDKVKEKGLSLIEKALEDRPDLIILQELFTTIYFPQYEDDSYFKLAEEIPGDTTEKIQELIKGYDVIVVAPVFEKSGNRYYCSAQLIDSKDGYFGTYRKLHIPTVKNLHEDYFFEKGDLGHRTFVTRKGNMGIMLCYDRHFPESAKLYGLHDVDLLAVCAATPKGARNIFITEMQAHAFSNSYYLACSNRCGAEDRIEFLGTSFICDHKGNILFRASEDEDEIILSDINLEEARTSRRELSYYRDRRPELYTGIASI